MSSHLTNRQWQAKESTAAILTSMALSLRNGIFPANVGSRFHNDHKAIDPEHKVPPRHGKKDRYRKFHHLFQQISLDVQAHEVNGVDHYDQFEGRYITKRSFGISIITNPRQIHPCHDLGEGDREAKEADADDRMETAQPKAAKDSISPSIGRDVHVLCASRESLSLYDTSSWLQCDLLFLW